MSLEKKSKTTTKRVLMTSYDYETRKEGTKDR